MEKRTFLKLTGIVTAGTMISPIIGCNTATDQKNGTSNRESVVKDFTLPKLGFAHSALAPAIDTKTMEIHHGKHHAGYVRKLNAALKDSSFAGKSLETILSKVTKNDTAIRNNGGGHYNHSLFWSILGPANGALPTGKLADAIARDFGSFEKFKAQLHKAGKTVFGSGWAWLCVDNQNKLFVTATPNQDNPLMTKLVKRTGTPILGVDVWEHAYYLNYQNRRGDYLTNFFKVINWEAVENRFNKIG